MRLFQWLAVAFVLAGTTPTLAQDIPDEATRARVADFVDRCGAQEGELRAYYGATSEMLKTGRGLREFLAQPENRVVAETARQFIGTCSPVGFAPEVTRHKCGSIAGIIYSPGNSAGDVMRNPGRYLDPDSGLSEDQRQYVRIYLERCVPAYAAALDELSSDDILADIQQEETGPAGSGPLHGSIAFSQDDDGAYAWGIAWSFDSSAGAQSEALGQCREYGGTRCAEAGWFQEACGALAIGDGNGYGTGWGATTGEAERDALAQCRVSNDDCRIEVARCSRSEEAGGQGRLQEEDQAVMREPAIALDPQCADIGAAWHEAGRTIGLLSPQELPSCWREIAEMPGCHVFGLYGERPVSWSGECSAGVASGHGELVGNMFDEVVDGSERAVGTFKTSGTIALGKKRGRWVFEYASSYGEATGEGSFQDGVRNGRWVYRDPYREWVDDYDPAWIRQYPD